MDTGKFTGFEVKLEKPGVTAISDHHPDSREGVKAFGEKRDPHFNQWLREFE